MFDISKTANAFLPSQIPAKSLWLKIPFMFLLATILITGCDSNSAIDDSDQLSDTIRVSDLAVDPFVGFVDGRPVGTGAFTYFSLLENKVISETDSSSTKWDIALQGTTLRVNRGLSGPGNGAVQIIDGLFEEILLAPESGWKVETVSAPAITPGSGAGWYNYNPATMVISPVPGRVILVRTAGGLYSKLRILSYYKGMPETPTAESEARYILFEYVIQRDGSRSFE